MNPSELTKKYQEMEPDLGTMDLIMLLGFVAVTLKSRGVTTKEENQMITEFIKSVNGWVGGSY